MLLPVLASLLVSGAPCIVIDAGHGGAADAGATFETLKEKDLTLALARRLQEQLLAQGILVVTTREGDQGPSLQERARNVAASGCAALVSIHFNASTEPKLAGIETYYLDTLKERLPARLADVARAQTQAAPERTDIIVRDIVARHEALDSGELAVRILRAELERLKAAGIEVKAASARHDLFELLMSVSVPAVIVEGGYISNPTERARLTDSRYQNALAQGITDGVLAFFAARGTLADHMQDDVGGKMR